MIESIHVFSTTNELMVTSNRYSDLRQLQLTPDVNIPRQSIVENFGSYIVIYSPIWSDLSENRSTGTQLLGYTLYA